MELKASGWKLFVSAAIMIAFIFSAFNASADLRLAGKFINLVTESGQSEDPIIVQNSSGAKFFEAFKNGTIAEGGMLLSDKYLSKNGSASDVGCAGCVGDSDISAISGSKVNASFGSQNMTVSGNVGIGTTYLTEALNVIGNVNVTRNITLGDPVTPVNTRLFVYGTVRTESNGFAVVAFQTGCSACSPYTIRIYTTGELQWSDIGGTYSTNLDGNTADLLRTDDNFVAGLSIGAGRGSNAPSERLHINGSVRVDNATSSPAFFVNTTLGNGVIRINLNSTYVPCNVAVEGSIAFLSVNGVKGHYGCNGTAWYALY